jgi:hypothetical protein
MRTCLAALTALLAVTGQQPFKPPEEIEHRKTDIMSDGVRLSAELFSLKEHAGKKLPTVVMSHGWGGVAASLRTVALDFARAGYLVLAFDYRGWGASDGRLVATTKPLASKRDGKPFTAEVQEIREYVDPLEQTADIFNAIHWVAGDPQCDPERIGLWGSSYSGGHVVHVAAREPRVRCTVSQVPGMDSRFVTATDAARNATRDEATKRARGEISYPLPGARAVGALRGAPIREKLSRYAPVEDAALAKQCAMLFIVAEKEELFSNADHGKLAHDRATGPKKYVEIPDITHYGIYTVARERATKLAVEWYDEHLKK